MSDFFTLRQQYPEFVYNSYSVTKTNDNLKIKYFFEIKGLEKFSPEWNFPITEDIRVPDLLLDNLVFSLGLVELISYWKLTCSPVVRILPHGLTKEMIDWWKSLYFDGLGEFFYVNGIKTDKDTFMPVIADGEVLKPNTEKIELSGNLVTVGGGKDSAVALSILSDSKSETTPYIINPRGATTLCCEVAGYNSDKTYTVGRTLDKNMLELNKKGFLNGHTPFSSIVAFSSIIAALFNGKKYVVLSNESSANESTVLGENVNHQFSKSEEFEKNFIEYQRKYLNHTVEYFSILRPLSEMQIAALFAKYSEFHPVFKSCNVGSKSNIWCCNCPKCLFVYIILSPFLEEKALVDIFGENLLDKESLIKTFKELIGVLPNKPFECVGSRDEVVSACVRTLEKYEKESKKAPKLLEYFKSLEGVSCKGVEYYMSFFDQNHHLPDSFITKLNSELKRITDV